MPGLPVIFVGTTREHYTLLFSTAGGVALVAGFVGAWIGARFAARGAARAVLLESALERDAGTEGSELRRLGESVDAIVVEVERIAEAQRFVTRVLVERVDQRPPLIMRREPGSVTPH